jgi:phosphocarrier protein FPr
LTGGATESSKARHPEAAGLELPQLIQNPNGLHARPAARLVDCIGAFSAKVVVEKDGTLATAGSINQIATLGIRQEDRITLWLEGEDAAAARNSVKALHADHFGDRMTGSGTLGKAIPRPMQQGRGGVLTGIPAAEGIAIGPAVKYVSPPHKVSNCALPGAFEM